VAFERERKAAAGLRDSPTDPGPPARLPSASRKALSGYFALPRMPGTESLLAAALLFVLVGAPVAWRMQSSSVAPAPVASIQLIALRGGEGYVALAPSGRPLELVFGRTDLPVDLSYRAQVVNSSGRQVWSGSVRIADQSLSIRVNGPLRAGAYWVRLYTSAGQLLREFGLRVG
jgi:hypothetical protein